MKFLVDAQLPRRLAKRLVEAGHDAIHTLDMPDGNASTDAAIIEVARREGRIVVTKDADFLNSFVLKRQPEKLLLISTGNITNPDLDTLILRNLPAILDAFRESDFVELTRTALVVHQ